ncbi:MAG: integrase, partial [Rhodobacterales bacterium]|nr:integrase [Rhodobacterales bacterium]MDX5498440.1 integrase [Rhodobacterales bacterium]
MKQPAPFLRGNVYYFTQRVPKRFANVETRKMIWQSLDTDSLSAATAKATQIWNEMIAAWQARQDGLSEDAERKFTTAKRIAQRHGLAYLPQDQVLALPTDDLLARIEAIPEV